MQCAACDDRLLPSQAYACSSCPSDLTPACAACSIDLHRPHRSSRHRLMRLDSIHLAPEDEDRIVGNGFCAHCPTIGRTGVENHLAILECEQCLRDGTTTTTPALKPLCLDCDILVHQSIDMDEHTRLVFESDTKLTTRQSGLYTLASIDGLQVRHQDSMESYAGRIWPGSMMLARYLEQIESEDKEGIKNKRIIELGCGCAAIPSLACWLLGASHLLCTDMNTDGLDILDENIESLKIQLKTRDIQVSGRDETRVEEDVDDDVERKESGPLLNLPLGMSTRRLTFGEDVSELAGEFDIILGSYILYDPDSFEPLVRTLQQLAPEDVAPSHSSSSSSSPRSSRPAHRSPVILLTSHEPTRESAFLTALTQRGFEWRRIPFSLQTAQLSDERHAEDGRSNIGTGLRSTSILEIRRRRLKDDNAKDETIDKDSSL